MLEPCAYEIAGRIKISSKRGNLLFVVLELEARRASKNEIKLKMTTSGSSILEPSGLSLANQIARRTITEVSPTK